MPDATTIGVNHNTDSNAIQPFPRCYDDAHSTPRVELFLVLDFVVLVNVTPSPFA